MAVTQVLSLVPARLEWVGDGRFWFSRAITEAADFLDVAVDGVPVHPRLGRCDVATDLREDWAAPAIACLRRWLGLDPPDDLLDWTSIHTCLICGDLQCPGSSSRMR